MKYGLPASDAWYEPRDWRDNLAWHALCWGLKYLARDMQGDSLREDGDGETAYYDLQVGENDTTSDQFDLFVDVSYQLGG